MKNTDRFLYGIVAVIVLLLVVSFGLVYTRPAPSYQPEDTAEGVVQNYLLALQTRDHERAYSYLYPKLPGYPVSIETFSRDISRRRWDFEDIESASFTIISSKLSSQGGRATIEVQQLYFEGRGLFDSSETTNTLKLFLRKHEGMWKIDKIEGGYWSSCWDNRTTYCY